MTRPLIYETYAKIATALGERSTCSSRAKVGAILYDDDYRIIATGYNGSPRHFPHCDEIGCALDSDGHCKNSIHAEENALLQCAVIGRSTVGLMIFTTHSPCWHCALRLLQAGITRVTYMQPYGSVVEAVVYTLHEHGCLVEHYIG
jgi:dCMP deaminase